MPNFCLCIKHACNQFAAKLIFIGKSVDFMVIIAKMVAFSVPQSVNYFEFGLFTLDKFAKVNIQHFKRALICLLLILRIFFLNRPFGHKTADPLWEKHLKQSEVTNWIVEC